MAAGMNGSGVSGPWAVRGPTGRYIYTTCGMEQERKNSIINSAHIDIINHDARSFVKFC
jgi:hypothetical protein